MPEKKGERPGVAAPKRSCHSSVKLVGLRPLTQLLYCELRGMSSQTAAGRAVDHL